MKRLIVIAMALAIAVGSQAQIGGLVGSAVRRGVQKSVEKKVEQTAEQKADELLGVKKNKQSQTNPNDVAPQKEQSVEEEGDHIPTPEEVMDMVPKIPTFQQLSEYLCEQSRENPRTLKLLANPTTSFLTQMAIALANGYVTMVASNGSIYTMDEQLRKDLGITDEQYDAMSEEEQQALARKYAAELEQRYARTVEVLANDSKYTKLTDEYNAIEDEVGKIHTDAEEACAKIWKEKYADKGGDLCGYYRDAVPVYYKAVMQGMEIRKSRQLAIAKQIDERVQTLAKQQPKDVFAGFYNQGGLCATSYVTDAALLTSIPDPR